MMKISFIKGFQTSNWTSNFKYVCLNIFRVNKHWNKSPMKL